MSIRTRTLVGAGALLASTALAGDLTPPPGAPGPTMKTLSEVEPRRAIQSLAGSADAKHRITQPGSYYLTEDLVVNGDKHAIEIASHNVTIDLNGFAIIGANQPNRSGISQGMIQLNNITVRNGSIRDFGFAGVDLQNFDDYERPRLGTIERVTVTNCGIGIGGGEDFQIRDCIVRSAEQGIVTWADSSIEGCYVANAANVGISALTGGAVVRDCQVQSSGNGIMITQGIVEGCLVRSATDDGIWVGSSGSVRGCDVLGSSGDGIHVGTSGLVENNRVSFPGGAGVSAGTGSRVAHNQITGSTASMPGTQVGVLAEDGSVHIIGNSVRHFDIGIQSGGFGGSYIVGNVLSTNSTAMSLAGANVLGPQVSGMGTIATTNPWANFVH